jgi:hypothetical protein
MTNARIIKLSCSVPGHEDDWIEIDTTTWTPADFLEMIDGLGFKAAMRYLREFVVDWHLTGDNGLVKFPGVTRQLDEDGNDVEWNNAMRRLGPSGLRLMRWLSQTPAEALIEAIDLDPKSAGVNDGAGAGKGKDDAG